MSTDTTKRPMTRAELAETMADDIEYLLGDDPVPQFLRNPRPIPGPDIPVKVIKQTVRDPEPREPILETFRRIRDQ